MIPAAFATGSIGHKATVGYQGNVVRSRDYTDYVPYPGPQYVDVVGTPSPFGETPQVDKPSYSIGHGDQRVSSRIQSDNFLVGDVITIQITENLSASQSAKTDVSRQSSLSAGVSAFPFLGAGTLADLNAGAKSANSMSGDGKTEASNTFRGSITAVVTDVLPNGHLVVIGEKQIGVNQAVDVLQFSGTVDPRAIRPGNTVLSTQVANVRVLSRGLGAPADAQTFGWLARFFLTLLPF